MDLLSLENLGAEELSFVMDPDELRRLDQSYIEIEAPEA
jgi:hypothetical protein